MGIQASPLDTSRFFKDPRLAEFADDLQRGDLSRVQAGLRAGIDPNATGMQGFRPIFFVFPAKNADAARALLAAGADPNVKLQDGTPPLLFAVRLENPEFTQVLLEYGADANSTRSDEQPVIHEAVLVEATENIRLLARAGADINAVWGGGTPLYRAINAWSLESAVALLDLGADTEWRKPTGRARMTAGENFCSDMQQRQPTVTNRGPIRELFAAFARRGVKLPCASEAARFE